MMHQLHIGHAVPAVRFRSPSQAVPSWRSSRPNQQHCCMAVPATENHSITMGPECGHRRADAGRRIVSERDQGHAEAGSGAQSISAKDRAALAATATCSDATAWPLEGVEAAVPIGAEASTSRRQALGSVVAAAVAAAATALPAHAMKTVSCLVDKPPLN